MKRNFENGYALIIGINAYESLPKLRKARADAEGLFKALTEHGGYLPEHIMLLKDGKATKSAIDNGLKWVAQTTGEKDTVIIYFSGHGVRPIGGFQDGKEYLCPVGTRSDELPRTAISSQELTTAIKAIKAEKLAIFLDACHSGGVGELISAQGLQGGFSQETYDHLVSGTGRVLIASCTPQQVSWELGDMDNGVFTHHLLVALRGEANLAYKNNEVGISNLFFNYLSTAIPQTFRDRLLTQTQTPLIKMDKVTQDFPIAFTSKKTAETQPPYTEEKNTMTADELKNNSDFQKLVRLVRLGKVVFVIGNNVSEEIGLPTLQHYRAALETYARGHGVTVVPEASFDEIASALEEAKRHIFTVRALQLVFQKAEDKANKRTGQNLPLSAQGIYRLLPALSRFSKAILTTNWDDLLLDALKCGNIEDLNLHVSPMPTAPPVPVKLLGSFTSPKQMIISNPNPQKVLKAIKADDRMRQVWEEITNPKTGTSFVFIGYDLEQSAFKLLQDLLLKANNFPPQRHFFIAPLSSEEMDNVRVVAGISPIATTGSTLILALFRELCQFIDREKEQEMIFVEKYQFIEFYGDFGSGKTALLDTAAKRAEAEGWPLERILHVNWEEGQNGSPPQALIVGGDQIHARQISGVQAFGQFLHDSNGVFLIFDGVEGINKDLLENILQVAVQEILRLNEQNKHSKLLLAGPRPVSMWPKGAHKCLYSYRLPSMESAEAHDMARAFLLAADPSSQAQFAQELIKDICETSCGHPGFIKAILGDLTSENKQAQGHIQLPPRLTDEEKNNYIQRFNADIDCHIPWGDDPQIKEIYEKYLCVLRFINREILDALGAERKDTWARLIELQLLSSNESNTNLVIRQMRALKLHHEHKDAYYAAHRRMLKIYLTGAHQLADEIQRKYMQEVLFHLAHMLLTKVPSQNERYRRISKVIKQLNFQMLRDLPIGIQDNFIDQMNRDIELSNLLEECVGTNNLQQLQDLFREKEIINA